jgi:phospholipase D-like protein
VILATSTFLQAIFACLILTPIILLWIVALVDVIRSHHSGLAIAATIVLILIVPILGPILYFVFRKPSVDAEQARLANEDLRRERANRPAGSMFS